jgi:hypothetical protein
MYCDPLAAEGLFPLANDDSKTERDLPFEYTPGVDYFKKFDALLPPWRPAQYEKVAASDAAWTENGGGPVEVRVGRRETRTLSHRRYARAIAPDGSLRQVTISTVRPTPKFPDGLDACMTHARFPAKKSALGFLFVENEPIFWSPFAGRRGQEYAAWAWAVMEYRKAHHAEYEAKEAKAYMSNAERATEKQTDVIAKALTAALENRSNEQPRATRGK